MKPHKQATIGFLPFLYAILYFPFGNLKVSVARAKGLNRTAVKQYVGLLKNVLEENGLIDKPGNIFNMDGTCLQLNNKPGKVVALKGSNDVTSVTSGVKGETISVLACVNEEGTFLSSFCIMKGKNLKQEFCDGMPPGAAVKMFWLR